MQSTLDSCMRLGAILFSINDCSRCSKQMPSQLWVTIAADRFQDSLLKHVKAPGLQGDANGLLVLVIVKATQEHLVDNALKAGVDAFLLLILWQLSILYPQLGVMVDAFGWQTQEKGWKEGLSFTPKFNNIVQVRILLWMSFTDFSTRKPC